eukprot:GEZU01023434.1.p1 GENE.GEZU01023434.1~~GEZU01023434.1.p1  ORF type:complete len:516 (+),score=156.75 GEZU01023434.1:395-1942(+)
MLSQTSAPTSTPSPTAAATAPAEATVSFAKEFTGPTDVKHATSKLSELNLEENKKDEKQGQAPSQHGTAASNNGAQGKSKAELRAERRAIQEAQRKAKTDAKAAAGQGPPKPKAAAAPKGGATQQQDAKPATPSAAASSTPTAKQSADKQKAQPTAAKQQPVVDNKGHPFFLHLPQYEPADSVAMKLSLNNPDVHPAMVQLGFKYASGLIVGSNARCVALLNALKEVVKDYQTPLDKAMSRDFDAKLKPQIQFIKKCRPMSISMGNAIKYFKVQVHKLTPDLPESEAKAFLIEKIDNFIKERILFADKIIAEYGAARITDGDVILTFSRSSVVEATLKQAKEAGKNFSVIVADSNARHEGKELLRQLASAGIKCSYVLLNGISHMMKDVSKVFLGAHTLLSNGNVVSRAGTAAISMVASNYNKPVLVLCETYKFSERVQLDAICANELGDPDAHITSNKKLADWRSIPSLKLLNLVYDLTPSQFVSMVITEMGTIPTSSVPVIIREREEKEKAMD